MKLEKFIAWQWAYAKWFAVAWTILIPLIVIFNFVAASEEGSRLPWELIPVGMGMFAFGIALIELNRRWFNFMLGRQACMWRKPQ